MLNQEQEFDASPAISGQKFPTMTTTVRGLLRSLLVGFICACVLTLLLALAIFWPFHLFDHFIWLIIIGLIEFLLFSVVAYLGYRPFTLYRYLRAVHGAQRTYYDLYTPLAVLTNFRKTADSGSNADIATIKREEHLSILDLVSQQETHQFILGASGAGKTMALRVYLFLCSLRPFRQALRGEKVPIFLPMSEYSLYLRQRATTSFSSKISSDENGSMEPPAESQLLAYMQQTNDSSLHFLRPYIDRLFVEGRLLLLCDGLDEIDSLYLSQVCDELVSLMRTTNNRLVVTCREVDYRKQGDLAQLVEEGRAARADIYSLDPTQVQEFVSRYIERQDGHWSLSTAEIMAVIDRSRLRYHCTNPMMLFTFLEVIDKIGIERGRWLDTRGSLLRESVRQMIEDRLIQVSDDALDELEIIRFLSEVACAARWAHERNAIQLRVSSSSDPTLSAGGKRAVDEPGEELRLWLDEHPAQSPFFDSDERLSTVPSDEVGRILRFAQSAGIIEISLDGVLSFCHELIAEYFVAEYFYGATATAIRAGTSLPDMALRDELLDDIEHWSGPVALWAGLLEQPLDLAACFGRLGLQQQECILQALTLGLICVGVLWTPPQAEQQQDVTLPQTIEDALTIAIRDRQTREELATMFQRCAEEGGAEVYRSLLPLVTVDGVDDLLAQMDIHIVPDLLFTQLQDAADSVVYEPQVKRIVRVLGRFGAPVVSRAAELSLPAPERSLRLRAAAVNTLGWTADASAIEPLFERLRDTDEFIAKRATNALMRLGPPLALDRIFMELENRTPGPYLSRVHQAMLAVLERFVDPPDGRFRLSTEQYQHVIEHIVPLLTSNYETEPDVQEVAAGFLIDQGQRQSDESAGDKRAKQTIGALLSYLTTQDQMAVTDVMGVLHDIGSQAVPYVIERLQHPTELVRVRAIEILSASHDYRALLPLLQALNDPQDAVWTAASRALQGYVPESIPGLIEQVLTGPNDEVAERASSILQAIGGDAVVTQVIDALAQVSTGRSRFLVQLLERLGDQRAVPALIHLVDQGSLSEPLLSVAIIRALCAFPEERIVPPLLKILALPSTLVYEAAILALSQMPQLAFDGLIEALDEPEDTPFTQRVRRAILLMTPFPGAQLIQALERRRSEAQAQQIVQIFTAQGKDAAQMLVQNLVHHDESVRSYIHQALGQVQGPMVVPALLDGALQPSLRKTIGEFLLKYPSDAIPSLVGLLGEHERGAFAADLLPRFGEAVLRPLIVALNDGRAQTRESAQQVIVTLVQQDKEQSSALLQEAVRLFYPPLPMLARQSLMDILTDKLVKVSMPALLSGLEDIQLLNDVADAFLRMAQNPALQEKVLDELVSALYHDERRQGAEIALVRQGALVVSRIGDLIINDNPAIATSARTILSEIGAPALSFIWTAQSDRSNLERREAAMKVFSSMPPEVIKDDLLELLVSDDRDNVAMAASLFLAKIHEEARQPYQDQVMVPELIDYMCEHDNLEVNQRVMALLLLLGEPLFVDHLLQALWERPRQRKQLFYLLMLLSPHSQRVLLENFEDPDSSPDLRAELAMVLGITTAPGSLVDYVRHISAFGFSPQRNTILQPDELTIALRALGGLLASGNWDLEKLQDLRNDGDDTLYEISGVLLGVRYEPQLARLQHELESQRETFKKELLAVTAKMEEQQSYISKLELDLEKINDTHSDSVDELQKVTRERDLLKVQIARLNKDKTDLLREKNEEIENLKQDRDVALQNYHILQRHLSNALGDDDAPRSRPSRPDRSRPSRY